MAHISDAFRFIVPKYRFHTNQAFMVIDNRWQAQDHIEPRTKPCNTLKYPVSGNSADTRNIQHDWSLLSTTNRSPNAVLNDWVGLPRVRLPYNPPSNIGLNQFNEVQAPMFLNESMMCGCRCSSIDTCGKLRSFKPNQL
jgi:hypothetical protein